MKPQKAIELVTRYAALTKGIKDAKREIGQSLDQCNGVSGVRRAFEPFRHIETDSKNREVDLHLVQWYTPFTDDDAGYPQKAWHHVNADEHGQECPHCYAAHLAVQKRKELKKQLGSVRRSMSRSIA